jgi:hypothetical protein
MHVWLLWHDGDPISHHYMDPILQALLQWAQQVGLHQLHAVHLPA